MKKSTGLLGAIALSLIASSGIARAQEPHFEALASVAHKLGLQYTYLESEDAVTMSGHGMNVTVRPGSAFFYLGGRVLPIDGGVPVFSGTDVYVPHAFVRELAAIEHGYDVASGVATHAKMPRIGTLAAEAAAPPVERHATSVRLATVPGTENLLVSGSATPGALVSIVLKAISSRDVPTVFLSRSFVEASDKGRFEATLPMAPAYFNGTEFLAEASGIDDQNPIVAHFSPPLR